MIYLDKPYGQFHYLENTELNTYLHSIHSNSKHKIGTLRNQPIESTSIVQKQETHL